METHQHADGMYSINRMVMCSEDITEEYSQSCLTSMKPAGSCGDSEDLLRNH